MKRPILTFLVLATALTAVAQATQPCVVKQYNLKQQKTPHSIMPSVSNFTAKR